MAHARSKVAYLVVCWNNREIIDECIEALQTQTYEPNDIYIIDNASSDGTADHIRAKHKDVHLIASDTNNGFAKGNNILIKEALKDAEVGYVALINSDAMLDKDWTKSIVDFIVDKPKVAAAQGITLDYYNRNVIDAAHIYVRDDFQSVQYGYLDSFTSAYDYPRRVFGVNAAAAIYTRDFLESQRDQKLFDEKFFMYLEDVDASFRALVTGWDNYYVPAAKAYHMGSASSKKRSSTFNIQWTVRNQSALLFKNLPFRVFIKMLPNAIRFERHFYKSIAREYSRKDASIIRRKRLIGIMRLPLYIRDKVWVCNRFEIEVNSLENIISRQGIKL